jgi:hypothetical protein
MLRHINNSLSESSCRAHLMHTRELLHNIETGALTRHDGCTMTVASPPDCRGCRRGKTGTSRSRSVLVVDFGDSEVSRRGKTGTSRSRSVLVVDFGDSEVSTSSIALIVVVSSSMSSYTYMSADGAVTPARVDVLSSVFGSTSYLPPDNLVEPELSTDAQRILHRSMPIELRALSQKLPGKTSKARPRRTITTTIGTTTATTTESESSSGTVAVTGGVLVTICHVTDAGDIV